MNKRNLFLAAWVFLISSSLSAAVNLDVDLVVDGYEEIKAQLVIDEVTRCAECNSERVALEATVEENDTESRVNFKILKKLPSGELEMLAEPVCIVVWGQEAHVVMNDANRREQLSLTFVANK